MEFRLETVFRRDKFAEAIKRVFDQRSLSRFSAATLKEFTNDDYTPAVLSEMLGSTLQNDSTSLQLKVPPEDGIREIFGNWYNVNYIVKMDEDLIHDMSPGKKALVLLKLLIGLAQTNSPILIDQPEDDLDNRSIFDDLVQYIKRRKVDRQIIIVTHNANIVVGGDSEQVIVANQDGKNCRNKEHKFEYRSGAIEDNTLAYDEFGNCYPGVLSEMGIQSHICEVLEGGTRAFELRKGKYFIVS